MYVVIPLCSVMAQFAFSLSADWELPRSTKAPQHKAALKEGVRDMLIKHHLFSWDLNWPTPPRHSPLRAGVAAGRRHPRPVSCLRRVPCALCAACPPGWEAVIGLIHKSHNAPVPYPTMPLSEQKCAHFCSEWCIVWYGADALWDLWDWSIQSTDTENIVILMEFSSVHMSMAASEVIILTTSAVTIDGSGEGLSFEAWNT